jgi:hypothetical protein
MDRFKFYGHGAHIAALPYNALRLEALKLRRIAPRIDSVATLAAAHIWLDDPLTTLGVGFRWTLF